MKVPALPAGHITVRILCALLILMTFPRAATAGWEEVLDHAPWVPATLHGAVVFNGSLWLLSATYGTWTSSDGYTWTQTCASPPWPNGRYACVFDGRIWIICGYSSKSIWNSADGISWNCVAEETPLRYRHYHTVAVFQNKMWVFGGYVGDEPTLGRDLADLWNSSDGINWNLVTDTPPWRLRRYSAAIVFQDRLWLIGGLWGDPSTGWEILLNDVWSTEDGVNWTQVCEHAPWRGRDRHSLAVFDDKMWMIGGDYGGITEFGGVWYTSDGINWMPDYTVTNCVPRWSPASVVYDNK
ncbi:MAG TPA: hypothetical protein PLI09_20990, partial [Candidatus Hydrogenedentes bacterium]|nr:hypothetical protein [Candidatus Hydrogenedentota bacterium]